MRVTQDKSVSRTSRAGSRSMSTSRLHRFSLPKPRWPVAVYEGDTQLICEADYVQTAEVFWVATKNPAKITLRALAFEHGKTAMTEEICRALSPDDRERCSGESFNSRHRQRVPGHLR